MFWMMLLVSVVVAAFIGGVTNHLAIKMLFFPHTEKRLFGVRLPFTPGIIPKRRNEIAGSFGRIVGTHLITSDAIKKWLREPSLALKMTVAIDDLLRKLVQSEDTIESFLLRFVDRTQVERWKVATGDWAHNKARSLLHHVWQEKGIGTRPLQQLFQGWNEEKRREWSGKAVSFAFAELGSGLKSSRGDVFLRQMVEQLIEHFAGDGFFGGMVKGFLKPETVSVQLRGALLDKLDEPATRALAEQWLAAKIEQWEQLSADDVFRLLTGADGRKWMEEQVLTRLDLRAQATNIFSLKIADLLDGQAVVSGKVIADLLIDLLDGQLESILSSLNLAKLVEEQVAQFPIEQIERMILDVSGREFRAITWLGAGLGAVIGLIQYLFISWMQ